MALAVCSAVLKLSFCKIYIAWGIAALSAVLIGSSWPLAIEQSKTQITDWLSNPSLMTDTAILINIEVALQMVFCIMHLRHHKNNIKKTVYILLEYFPGILFLFVLFSLLVALIFSLPGVAFPIISWGFSLAILLLLPILVRVSKRMLPDENTRLEILFLINMLIALMGITATVNGRITMPATNNVEWRCLLSVLAIIAVGAITGFFLHRLRFYLKEKNMNNL